jgi:PAS domain S-box-containing protein
VAVYTTDPQGHVTHFNPAAAEFAGRTAALGTDQWCVSWKLYYPDGTPMPHEECPMADSLRTGREVHGAEAIIERPDGTRRWFRANPTLLRDARGEIVGAMNMLADITASKEAEGVLLQADRHKNEFLAMLAHELRNPLAPIRNALEIIRLQRPMTAAEDGPIESAVAMMGRQLSQMVRLIDELLNVSRISRGAIELRRQQADLSSIGRDVANSYVQVCESLGIDFMVALPAGPVYADVDPVRLVQIMENLLSNACKFTRQGGGVIRLSLERADPAGPDVVIQVSDNGIGIESGDLQRIFDLFTQVDTTLERGTGGLGIGLTLVKNLVSLHGGTIEARSAGIGQGSEFVVRLPIVVDTPVAAATPASGEPVPALDCRILVVDDNRDSADSLAMVLQLRGNETRAAYDGLEAVAVAATFQPDIVLLDIGLPKLNGFDAARRIRDQSDGNGIVLVALTGWSQEADRQRALEAGFDGYAVKPVDHAVLHKLLQNLRSS